MELYKSKIFYSYEINNYVAHNPVHTPLNQTQFQHPLYVKIYLELIQIKIKTQDIQTQGKGKKNRPEDDRYLMYFEEIERNV